MREAAQATSIWLKISGVGVPGKEWTVNSNRAIVLGCLDICGLDRTMFASHFPVDSSCGTFAQMFGGFESIVYGFASLDEHKFFAKHA